MEYRAVNGRCAVDLAELALPCSEDAALAVLTNSGFRMVDVDLVALARGCVGVSRYERGVHPDSASAVVDCSSFTRWLYGQRGIWMPRRSIQQWAYGTAVDLERVAAGDLVFATGPQNYYIANPSSGVGHVGIATGNDTVIHAVNVRVGVVEDAISSFIRRQRFRGVRRYIPSDATVLTLTTPSERCVETSDDVKWIVLQSLS